MFFGINFVYNFDPYHVLLTIATNILQRLKTGFVVQGHIFAFSRHFYPKRHFVQYVSELCIFLWKLILSLLNSKTISCLSKWLFRK